jgi:LPPG:FO 2-phospho-L-lactate transferase
MIVALAGGSGSSKLLEGLYRILRGSLTIIANVGDNYWYHGLYVCPDLDISTYALAGKLDRARGWGLKNDTFHFISQLEELGFESWFKLGDRDLAISVIRTNLLRRGRDLTSITLLIARRLGVKARIHPASNEHAPTILETDEGRMHLQEYWVKRRGQPRVRRVTYGLESAEATKEAVEAIRSAQGVIVCPGNPITSIGPIVAFEGIRTALKSARKVVAVSPIIGQRAFSGPAAKLMQELGVPSTVVGLSGLYRDFVDALLIDPVDEDAGKQVRAVGITPVFERITLGSLEDSVRVARRCLEIMGL